MWSSARTARTARPALAGLAAPALLLTLALAPALSGCTEEGTERTQQPTPTPTATQGAPALRERAAPYQVRFGRVVGDIPRGRRAQYLQVLARPVRAWVDRGFVAGPWPRRGFRSALAPFGRGVTAHARRDADVLTLQSAGPSLVEVIPQRRGITMSVGVVGRRMVGATAHVDLAVLGVDRAGERSRVHVRGDLYLTRGSRGWLIFGYDLNRWVDRGAMTATAPATATATSRGGGS